MKGDHEFEPDETVIATLNSGAKATHTIQNDDRDKSNDVIISPTQAIYEVLEGETVDVGVRLSRARTMDTTFKLRIRGSSATAGTDFSPSGEPSVTIPAGDTSYTLSVEAKADTVDESDEYFTVGLLASSLPSGVTRTGIGLGEAYSEIYIIQPRVELKVFSNETRVVEGDKVPVVVKLSHKRSVKTDVVVSVRHVDTYNSDFGTRTLTVTIPAGQGYGYGDFPSTFDDSSLEEDEKFQLYISDSGNVAADASKVMNVTLIDNDQNDGLIVTSSTPTPFSHDEALALVEGGGGGFSVRLASRPSSSGNVTVTISEENDPGNKIEFAGGAQQTTLTFTRSNTAKNSWHKPQTVSVWARQDADEEGLNRYLTITPVGGGYHPLLKERLRVSVNDDDDGQNTPTDPEDQVPDTPVSNVQASVIDDASATVTWDEVEHATSYQVEWEGNGQQFSSAGALPGISGTTATIDHQAQEALTLTIKVIPAYVDDDGDTQLLDDLAGTTSLDVGPAGGGQGDDPPSACVSDAQWNTVEGYYASNSGKAPNYGKNWYRVLIAYAQERTDRTLPAWSGATARPTTPYTVAEARESESAWSGWTPVREVLECVEAAHPPAPAPLQAPDPEISVSGGGDVTEGAAASFTITASPAPSSSLTVDLTVSQSGDFAASGETGSQQVTIPTGGSVTLDVATIDDGTDESDGSVSVTIDTGTGYTVAAAPNDAASVAVRDDDDPPVPVTACVSNAQ